jgi:long-chain acyl-CoA synthetase
MASNWRDAERRYDGPGIGMSTMPVTFEESAAEHADLDAQLYKAGIYDRTLTDDVLPAAPDGDFASITYGEMREIVRNLAAGFRELGLEAGDRIGLFSHTRMEWAQSDFAILAAGGVVTTVYSSSSEDQVRYLLSDPGANGVVVENGDHLERVLAVEDDLDLEFVVSFDELDGDLASTYEHREDVYTLADVHDIGAEAFDEATYEEWLGEREPDDLCSLIYTSGTTGQPKGVQLTHRNFRENVNQVLSRFGPREDKGDLPVLDEESRVVSYLPLAHVFERTSGHFVNFTAGVSVAYAEDPETLQEDFGLVKPTAATSVPRVYEKIYDAIREQASESGLKQRIFEWATGVGRQYQAADDPGPILRAKQGLADRLVFAQVKEALGGNIDFLFSGGGSLSPELSELYHGMGLPILEGYGLTETSPVVTTNPVEDPKIGTIGPPMRDVEVKVDESAAGPMDFPDCEGEVGELLVQGPNVTQGYWNLPEATEEAFVEDEDGRWFRTGDIMHIRPDGYLEFKERVKQLLVLSTGKNVAPAPIEDAFAASEIVEQAMVVGDGRKFISALVVPNFGHIESWAESEGIDLPEDPEAICEDERVVEYVQEEVDRVNEDFESHETIKKFRLVPLEFTEDNDLLTPTMKKKRRNILDYFEAKIEEMYAEEDVEAAA